MSKTIDYAQVIFVQQHKDEIAEVKEQFKRTRAKFMSNTLIQMSHFDMFDKIIQIGKFVDRDDLNETSLEMVKEYLTEMQEILGSDEFSSLEKSVKNITKMLTELKRKAKENSEEK